MQLLNQNTYEYSVHVHVNIVLKLFSHNGAWYEAGYQLSFIIKAKFLCQILKLINLYTRCLYNFIIYY